MSAGVAKLLELALVLAVVLGWGGYELYSLRRDRTIERRPQDRDVE